MASPTALSERPEETGWRRKRRFQCMIPCLAGRTLAAASGSSPPRRAEPPARERTSDSVCRGVKDASRIGGLSSFGGDEQIAARVGGNRNRVGRGLGGEQRSEANDSTGQGGDALLVWRGAG